MNERGKNEEATHYFSSTSWQVLKDRAGKEKEGTVRKSRKGERRKGKGRGGSGRNGKERTRKGHGTVSYTHLTLPTKA